jgi:predicted nucleotidyltransferase component of viral defense system
MQKAFGLPRYSEDLDFTLNGNPEPDMESISAFLSSGGFSGISWKIDEKKSSTTAKVRYRGPLYNGSSISEGAVLLELSKREKILLKPTPILITPPYPDLLPYQLLVMDASEIAAEKIRALFSRTSARDLFDLHFLLHQKISLKKSIVEEKLSYYKEHFDPALFKKNIEKLEAVWDVEIRALTPLKADFGPISRQVIADVLRQLD